MVAGFALSIVVLLGLAIASFVFINNVIETSRKGSSSQQILLTVAQLRTGFAELENARLKFALTAEERYLDEWRDDITEIKLGLGQLKSLTTRSSVQQESINRLEQITTGQVSDIAEAESQVEQQKGTNPSLASKNEDLKQKVSLLLKEVRDEESKVRRDQNAVVSAQFFQFIGTFSALLLLGLITPALLLFSLNANLKARAKSEEKLRLTLEANHDLYEHAPCGYFLIDESGMVSSMNETLLKWLGYHRSEIVNKLHVDQLLANAKQIFGDSFSGANGKGTVTDEESAIFRKNQSAIPVILNAVTVMNPGGKHGIIRCSLFDNTQRKLAEDETKALNRELEAFSYSVSHDLRAPLRSINGYVQVLNEDYFDKMDQEAKRFLKIISTNALRMGQLIDDLLHFSKTGKRELVTSTVDMNDIVNPIVDELTESEPGREIKVNTGKLGMATVDVSLMRQVWINLISNALKYTQKKSETRIEIGCFGDGKDKVYFVKDNGVGFNMKYVDKLFGVFQRLHKPEDFQGTGVGLALVKRIIDKHKGRIWVEAKEDEGATFYFSLPPEPLPRQHNA
jgi:PAS domain S-box-containing protein